MKKLFLSIAIILGVLSSSAVFAQARCTGNGICHIGDKNGNEGVNVTFVYNNNQNVLTYSFSADDLEEDQPDHVQYYEGQQTYTFGADFILPDDINDSLINQGFLNKAAVTFGTMTTMQVPSSNLVIKEGIAYPIAYSNGIYTVTVDMSQYPQSRHANTGSTTPTAISVYPNPASSVLNFDFPYSGSVTVKIMDITGRIKTEQRLNNTSTAGIMVDGYLPGIYLYQLITDGKTQTGRFIVN